VSEVRHKRGSIRDRGNVTPAAGELIVTTDERRIYLGDGSTAGGNRIAHVRDSLSGRVTQILKDPGATTMSALGEPAPTLDGTLSNDDVAAASGRPLIGFTTAGGAGTAAGLISTFVRFVPDWDPSVLIDGRLGGAVGNSRLWIGTFSASPDAITSPTGIRCAALFYDDTVHSGDRLWRAVTSNASATPTVTATATPLSGNDFYTLEILFEADSRVTFIYNGVAIASHTTELPVGTNLLGYGARVISLAAATRKIRVNRVRVAHR